MNLWDAIGYHDTVLNGFHIHPNVVFLCYRESQAAAAEPIFSLLAQCQTDSGRGFEHFETGLSNASNDKISGKEWMDFQRQILDTTPIRQNLIDEVQRIEERRSFKHSLETDFEELSIQHKSDLDECFRLTEENTRLRTEYAQALLGLRL